VYRNLGRIGQTPTASPLGPVDDTFVRSRLDYLKGQAGQREQGPMMDGGGTTCLWNGKTEQIDHLLSCCEGERQKAVADPDFDLERSAIPRCNKGNMRVPLTRF